MVKAYKSTIETLGDLRDRHYQLWAHCTGPNCGHGRPLDLDRLIERRGAGYVFINENRIARSCRCSCGHQGAVLTIAPPTPAGPK